MLTGEPMNEIILKEENRLGFVTKFFDNRDENVLGVNNDLDAISQWLRVVASRSKETEKSYRKEAKRLVLFCEWIDKDLVELTVKDINEFINILRSPPDDWVFVSRAQTTSVFQVIRKNGLSQNSINLSLRILANLYGYLNDAGYLKGNVIKLAERVDLVEDKRVDEKAMSVLAWEWLVKWMDERVGGADMPTDERLKFIRDRWVMHALYNTGMRRSSVVTARMADITPKTKNGVQHWYISFSAKGNKVHSVLLTDEFMQQLKEYRKLLGLSALPKPDEDQPLVHTLHGLSKQNMNRSFIERLNGGPISKDGVNYLIKQIFELAVLDCEDPYIRQELECVTPHTFRHTCATHRLIYGASIESTQKTLGHASITTTMIYTHVSDSMLIDEQGKIDVNKKNKRGQKIAHSDLD